MPARTIRFPSSSKNDGSICESNSSQTRSAKSRIFRQIPYSSGEFCRVVQTLATRDIMRISPRGRAAYSSLANGQRLRRIFPRQHARWLHEHELALSLEDVQRKIAASRRHYNESRAHTALEMCLPANSPVRPDATAGTMDDKETTSQLVAIFPYSIANRKAPSAIPAINPKGIARTRTRVGTLGSLDSVNKRRHNIRAAAQRKSIPLVAIGLHFLVSESLLTIPDIPVNTIETNRNKYPIICPLKTRASSITQKQLQSRSQEGFRMDGPLRWL